jgi:DNA-directed RNA polymerase subunit RPC12/RpoP
MLEGVDLVYVAAGAMALAVVAFIVRAVRLTNASIASASRRVDLTNPDVARSVIRALDERDVPCPRCGHETFALLGTETRYKCDSCNFEFDGPPHIPDPAPEPQNTPLYPS